MDILLINVPFVLGISKTLKINTCEEIKKWINAVGYAPPLGLGYMHAYLKEKKVNVEIIDLSYISFFNEEKFKIDIKSYNPTIIGLSFTTHSRLSVVRMIQLIREALPNIHITIGGHHVTSTPQNSLDGLDVDSIIIGDGEEALYKLFCDLIDHKTSQNYTKFPGLVYNKFKLMYNKNYSYALTANIDILPWPQRDTFNNEEYSLRFPKREYGFSLPKKVDYIITSRGCPYACRFCSTYQSHGRKLTRFRNIFNVIDEIEYLIKERNIDGLFIYDDNFIIDKQRIELFANEMKRRKIYIPFKIWARVDTVDYPTLRILKDIGLTIISFGMESGSNKVLKYYNKNISKEQCIEAIKMTTQLNIIPITTFIIGASVETIKDILETYHLIAKMSFINPNIITNISLFGLYIYPGTGIYYEAQNNGILPPDFDWYTYNPNIISEKGAPLYRNAHINSLLIHAKCIYNIVEYTHLLSLLMKLGKLNNKPHFKNFLVN